MKIITISMICLLSFAVTSCVKTRKKLDTKGMTPEQIAKQIAEAKRLEEERLEKERRAKESDVDGLTVGELEDQPWITPLPKHFDLDVVDSQVQSHALLTARAEVSDGLLPSTLTFETRYPYLLHVWRQALKVRQAELQKIKDGKDYIAKRRRKKVEIDTNWRDENRAAIIKHTRFMEKERMKVIPSLTEEEKKMLQE